MTQGHFLGGPREGSVLETHIPGGQALVTSAVRLKKGTQTQDCRAQFTEDLHKRGPK